VLIRPQPVGGSALVRDYLQDVPAAQAFFSGSPFQLESYRRKLAEVGERFDRSARERAANALRPTSEAARVRLEKFVEQGGAVVTTGQQTGFLTGPLYTIYKAISGVALAAHLERTLGVIVLPVFWIASEDHDWAEVNHAFVLDPAGRLGRFELPSGDPRPLPMSERTLTGDLDGICDDILQYVGDNKDHAACLREIVDPFRHTDGTMGEAFGAAIRAVLSRFDVLLADAAHRPLKEASKSILEGALVQAARQEEVLEERSQALEQAGYPTQVTILERGTNVFWHDRDGRKRLYGRGADFVTREDRAVLKREEVLDLLEVDPRSLSPNVLLRPVVESAVFPTLAYVGGPGEIGYFAQSGALFGCYEMTPPIAIPRFAATVLEPAIERAMTRLDLAPKDLTETRDNLRETLATKEVPADTRAAGGRTLRKTGGRGGED
jgi:bacillithiol synthase